MACGDYGPELSSLTSALVDGKFFDAITCAFANEMGGALFALMVFGALGMSLYIYSGSVIVPVVLAIIMGSAILVTLPSSAAQLAGIVILLTVTVGGYLMVLWLNRRR